MDFGAMLIVLARDQYLIIFLVHIFGLGVYLHELRLPCGRCHLECPQPPLCVWEGWEGLAWQPTHLPLLDVYMMII